MFGFRAILGGVQITREARATPPSLSNCVHVDVSVTVHRYGSKLYQLSCCCSLMQDNTYIDTGRRGLNLQKSVSGVQGFN